MLYDESGNGLYGAGTLNKSKTALILNAENVDLHCDWVPSIGDNADLLVPHILARTATDAASRLTASMKVCRSELRVERILARLQREAEEKRRQIYCHRS